MRFFNLLIIAAAIFFGQSAHASAFGADVAQCVVKHNVITRYDPTSAVKAYADKCEKEVEATRATRNEHAFANWRRCINLEVIRLDDEISQASDIAEIIKYKCGEEFNAVVDALAFDETSRKVISEAQYTMTRREAIKSIIEYRAYKKSLAVKQ